MVCVKVEILSVTDYSCPVFVKCRLVDCHGVSHFFHDKLPVVCSDYNYNADIPCSGEIRCTIIQDKGNTVIIDTSEPDDIESDDGQYRFEVYRNQVIL